MIELESVIDAKRLELYQIAAATGFASTETIRCSTELDQLILEYQKKN